VEKSTGEAQAAKSTNSHHYFQAEFLQYLGCGHGKQFDISLNLQKGRKRVMQFWNVGLMNLEHRCQYP
jgi:hypothetical protein